MKWQTTRCILVDTGEGQAGEEVLAKTWPKNQSAEQPWSRSRYDTLILCREAETYQTDLVFLACSLNIKDNQELQKRFHVSVLLSWVRGVRMNASHQVCASMVKHFGGGSFPYLLEYAVHKMTHSIRAFMIVPRVTTRSQICGRVAKGARAQCGLRVPSADSAGRRRYALRVAHLMVYVSKRVI